MDFVDFKVFDVNFNNLTVTETDFEFIENPGVYFTDYLQCMNISINVLNKVYSENHFQNAEIEYFANEVFKGLSSKMKSFIQIEEAMVTG